MRTISAGLQTHLNGTVTTMATCWKVTRTDGQVFGFTDHTSNLTISGVTYLAASGYTASTVQSSSGLSVDNLELHGALDSEVISEGDLLAGLWDFAEVEIFQVNYADLSMGTMKMLRGNLGEVRTGRNAFVVELRSLSQRLKQSIGRLIMPACNADLGDARCGINLATFPNGTLTGVAVTAVTSDSAFTASGLSAIAAGWFSGGLVTWTSGENEGLAMEVKSFPGSGVIELEMGMPRAVAAGDEFTITAGCDKSVTTCRTKFNNVINFRGFPHLPGLTRILGAGRSV